jgi:hypothetical protein
LEWSSSQKIVAGQDLKVTDYGWVHGP